jgi:hypothetical protein
LRASSASVKLCRYRGLFCIERHRTERGDQSFTLAGADEETRSDFAIWSVRAGGEGTVLTWWPTTATQTIMFPPGELVGDGAAGLPLTRWLLRRRRAADRRRLFPAGLLEGVGEGDEAYTSGIGGPTQTSGPRRTNLDAVCLAPLYSY